jgi:hypothetical protein
LCNHHHKKVGGKSADSGERPICPGFSQLLAIDLVVLRGNDLPLPIAL